MARFVRPLSVSRLREIFELREDGVLFNKIDRGKAKAGKPSAMYRKDGYGYVRMDMKTVLLHRIVFALHTNRDSSFEIDHIDGNPRNNHPENLREATSSQNHYNLRNLRGDNTSGCTGVTWHKSAKKWAVRICLQKSGRSFGLWDNFELACFISDLARERMFGTFSPTFRKVEKI